MIHILTEPSKGNEVAEMLQEYGTMIKVDIRLKILGGGSEMHSDCEKILRDLGSEQTDLWGANWFPKGNEVVFESLINIRPRDQNRGILIQNEDIRQKVRSVVLELLG